MKFPFIDAEKATFPIRLLCRVLEVSRSGYYAWSRRGPSRRQQEDERLSRIIVEIFEGSRGTYGSPRIHAELLERHECVSRKRVARLMAKLGLVATPPRRFRKTTDSSHGLPAAENILNRNFDVEAPNTAWVADISYIRTWEGWLYLAVVLDLYSRRVVGWALADHMRTELTLSALDMALVRRRPPKGLVHHSDRGKQYASVQYQQRLAEWGVVCSMSRKGDCWDNAVAESFFGTLRTDLLNRRPWLTKTATRNAVVEYIELFYNLKRRHSYLGNLSPTQHERLYLGEAAVAA